MKVKPDIIIHMYTMHKIICYPPPCHYFWFDLILGSPLHISREAPHPLLCTVSCLPIFEDIILTIIMEHIVAQAKNTTMREYPFARVVRKDSNHRREFVTSVQYGHQRVVGDIWAPFISITNTMLPVGLVPLLPFRINGITFSILVITIL